MLVRRLHVKWDVRVWVPCITHGVFHVIYCVRHGGCKYTWVFGQNIEIVKIDLCFWFSLIDIGAWAKWHPYWGVLPCWHGGRDKNVRARVCYIYIYIWTFFLSNISFSFSFSLFAMCVIPRGEMVVFIVSQWKLKPKSYLTCICIGMWIRWRWGSSIGTFH